MTKIEKSVEYITKKFTENRFQETRFFVPATNSTIWATPCAQCEDEISDVKDIEFILVSNNDGINVPGFDTVEAFAAFLADYPPNLVRELQSQKSCRSWYKTNIQDKLTRSETVSEDDWQYYSDWHKDCFGFRPQREQ